jgi:hypothetical protein
MLRDLFLNVKEFYSDRAMHALVKWPVYYTVSAVRLLQGSINTNGLYGGGFGGFNVPQPTTIGAMGMVLLNPPDVFGWPGREDWLTTSQLFARMNFASGLTSNRSTTPGNTGIPLDTVLATGQLGSKCQQPSKVVDYFINLLVQTPLAEDARQALIRYLKKDDQGNVGSFTLDATTKDKKGAWADSPYCSRARRRRVFDWIGGEMSQTTRRDFIKTGAAAVSMLPVINRQAYGVTVVESLRQPLLAEDRVLVIVELGGGNDPLEHFVPLQQYDIYKSFRSRLAIAKEQVLPLYGSTTRGLAPNLSAIKPVADAGKLAVIQAVHYPNPNLSHDGSRTIYRIGDTNVTVTGQSGWIGRHSALFGNKDNPLDTVGIGGVNTVLQAQGAKISGISADQQGNALGYSFNGDPRFPATARTSSKRRACWRRAVRPLLHLR